MRTGIYTRISLDREGDSRAVTRQREDALQLIERRGWELVAEYRDNDISAAGKRRRPGFETMLADIQAGNLQAIVAWNLDRITRNRTDNVRLIESCQAAGVTIALVRGSDLDMSTPSGRMTTGILAEVARNEIEVKSDRQKRANQQRAEDGRPHAARRAFGYGRNGIDLVPEEAALIRAAFEQILAGASIRSIVRDWNAAEAFTTAGNLWRPTTVRGVLKNPRYAGIRSHNGARMTKPAIWEPVVSENVWAATQSLLADPRRSTVTDRSVKFLLTSIAECGRCADGSKVATARTQHGVRNYKCVHGDLTRGATAIDALVEGLVIARLSRPDAVQLLKPSAPDVDIEALRAEATALRERLEDAARMYAKKEIQAAQLVAITRVLEDEISDLETQIADASRGSVLAGLIGSPDVAGEWTALDISRQRAIVRELFTCIVIEPVKRGARTFEPGSVTPTWRI
ncbi:recombinase family protein [Paeniglutamicibacter sp.]|uniref:recombinase family protein n=1 Tax=Paeniglutamicibacter sp. TaxID=1934391 RepID=UPI00398A4F36